MDTWRRDGRNGPSALRCANIGCRPVRHGSGARHVFFMLGVAVRRTVWLQVHAALLLVGCANMASASHGDDGKLQQRLLDPGQHTPTAVAVHTSAEAMQTFSECTPAAGAHHGPPACDSSAAYERWGESQPPFGVPLTMPRTHFWYTQPPAPPSWSSRVLVLAIRLAGLNSCSTLGTGRASHSDRSLCMVWLGTLATILFARSCIHVLALFSMKSSLLMGITASSIVGEPLMVVSGWCMVYSRRVLVREPPSAPPAAAAAAWGVPSAPGNERLHAIDTLPRAVRVILATGYVSVMIISLGLTGLTAYIVGGSRGAEWTIAFPASALPVVSPVFGTSALLCAHALKFSRRLRGIAQSLPAWSTARITRALEAEHHLLQTQFNTTVMSLLLVGTAMVVLPAISSAFLLFYLGLPVWMSVLTFLINTQAFVGPGVCAFLCVAEVTEAWLALPHALHAGPSAGQPDRVALALQLTEWRQRGLLGVRVLGVQVTHTLVVRGLSVLATLGGILTRAR